LLVSFSSEATSGANNAVLLGVSQDILLFEEIDTNTSSALLIKPAFFAP